MKKLLIPLLTIVFCVSCKQDFVNTKLSGPVFGTSYSVIYSSEINYQTQFDSLFYVINQSMSTYILYSDISKLNRNESNTVDLHFINVLNTSREIYNKTNGAFDPTIGAVVNAWDFGPEGKIAKLDSIKIDSIMISVGLDKVLSKSTSNGFEILKPKATYLDFNAIAKGYGVDVIADFLDRKNVKNYLVEIGGEIRSKGKNVEKNTAWKVGLDLPRFDGGQSVMKAIEISDVGMATSGTYRKFKVDDNGNRYAHIINTKTGYPSKTNILSVSVIAKNCMIADAYATAFQAMGIEKVKDFLKDNKGIKAFIIFENSNQELETLSINNFPE